MCVKYNSVNLRETCTFFLFIAFSAILKAVAVTSNSEILMFSQPTDSQIFPADGACYSVTEQLLNLHTNQ